MVFQPSAAEVIERWGSSEAPSPNLQGVQNQQDAASCLTSFDAVTTSAKATGTAIDLVKRVVQKWERPKITGLALSTKRGQP